jgi:conjugative transfer region protein TrbK
MMTILGRAIAYVALAGALLATAIILNDRRYPAVEAPGPSAATSALDAELVRCKAIGAEAAEDARCKSAWETTRKRFFQPGTPYQPMVTNAFSDELGVMPPGMDLPNTPPRSPAAQNSPRPPVDIAGQRK